MEQRKIWKRSMEQEENLKRSREKAKKEQRAKNWKEQGARGEIVKEAGSMDPPPNRGSLMCLLAVLSLWHPPHVVGLQFTEPCSKNDSRYIRKLEISNIKNPSCFVRLIPRYIQENLPNGFKKFGPLYKKKVVAFFSWICIRVLSAESWKNLTFFPISTTFSHLLRGWVNWLSSISAYKASCGVKTTERKT